MTHYNVLVIGPAEQLDSALAPFDENLEVEPYFQPVNDTFRTAVIAGESLDPSDDADLLPYIEPWYGRPGVIENGVAGYYTTLNPQAKWDYWSPILLPTRDGRQVAHLTKKEFDIVPFLAEARDEAEQTWKFITERGTPYLREMFGVTDNDTETTYIERCVAKTAKKPIPAYAVLGEGVWREPGAVGWFGTTSATDDDKEAFDSWFERFWNMLADDTPFTLVDCHI